MIAVRYNCLQSTRMIPLAATWEELTTILTDHREATAKLNGPLWSPVSPIEDGPHCRRNDAVATVTLAVLDVDDGSTLEAMTAGVTSEWVAYSTWGHRPEHPRFHLVIRLDEPVPARLWRGEYARINGHRADWLPAVSHAYFLPQHAPGAPWFVARSTDAVIFGGTADDRNVRVAAALAAYRRICAGGAA